MYLTFDSIESVRSYIKSAHAKQRVWCTLRFNTSDKFFLFWSTPQPNGQMYNIARNILTMSGHYGKQVKEGRELAEHLCDFLLNNPMSRNIPGRHAEAWMISDIENIVKKIPQPSDAAVLISMSPCTMLDSKPSEAIGDWPESCVKKIGQLSTVLPDIRWDVRYEKIFGELEKKEYRNKVDEHLKQYLSEPGVADRINISKYSYDLSPLITEEAEETPGDTQKKHRKKAVHRT